LESQEIFESGGVKLVKSRPGDISEFSVFRSNREQKSRERDCRFVRPPS